LRQPRIKRAALAIFVYHPVSMMKWIIRTLLIVTAALAQQAHTQKHFR
jgi:hypothetical protein